MISINPIAVADFRYWLADHLGWLAGLLLLGAAVLLVVALSKRPKG